MVTTTRNRGVDLARGLLIFYVVFIIHGLFWLKILPQDLSSILLFEMPSIFLISGYSYYLYENSSKYINPVLSISNYLNYLVSRLTRLLIPYYFYALVCVAICLVMKKPSWQLSDVVLYWLNPFEFGGNYSLGMLNWHLWFIAPFAIVTALLPFIARLKNAFQIPLLGWMIVAGSLIYLLSLTSFKGSELLKNIIFYSIWTGFGYGLAKYKADGNKFATSAYLALLSLTLIILALSQFLTITVDLNMQINKFPPNFIFFIFSCAWLSMLLLTNNYIKTTFINDALNTSLIKIFITSGFSIYLWQGLGYTLASFAKLKFDLNIFIVWLLALMLSVIMGVLFSPLERLKLNFLTFANRRSN